MFQHCHILYAISVLYLDLFSGNNPETDDKLHPFISRYVSWRNYTWPINYGCHGQWVRAVCVMGVGDLPELVQRKELFVNKLYLDYQHLALDCLEHWLFKQMKAEYNGERHFNVSYYQELDFVKNCNCER